MAKPRQLAETDPVWFKDRLRDRRLSLRGAARLMDLDPAAFHHMIFGRRKMSVSEAGELAKILGVDQAEVLARAGAGQATSINSVEILYNAATDGKLTSKESGVRITAPSDIGHHTIAARCEDPRSMKYGWVYFFEPSTASPRDFVNRLCMIETADGNYVATLLAGFETGKFNLAADGEIVQENVAVRAVAPVSWIKTTA